MRKIRIERIYGEESVDGYRVLVDRLWPRGISKVKANIALWPKELTPSSEIRKGYHEGKISYEEFRAAFEEELHEAGNLEEILEELRIIIKTQDIILVTSVKEIERSHVPVLKAFLEKRLY